MNALFEFVRERFFIQEDIWIPVFSVESVLDISDTPHSTIEI
jgi:hypothetical protein